MLIVVQSAGMGNQMFQYALAVYLKQRNRLVYLDVSQYQPPYERVHSGYDLYRAFRIQDPLMDAAALDQAVSTRRIQTISQMSYEPLSQYQQALDYPYEQTDPSDGQAIVFNGYWQYKDLLKPIEPQLRRAFIFHEDGANGRTRDLLAKLAMNDHESVAVHIRRGDYVSIGLGRIASPAYYEKALKTIISRVDSPIFYVFSDEPDWARANMRLPGPAVVVDWNRGEDSWQDMLLMSRCRHHVIPNSTFGWWAAWLAQSPGQTVVQPERFIPCVDNQTNYHWDGWIRVR